MSLQLRCSRVELSFIVDAQKTFWRTLTWCCCCRHCVLREHLRSCNFLAADGIPEALTPSGVLTAKQANNLSGIFHCTLQTLIRLIVISHSFVFLKYMTPSEGPKDPESLSITLLYFKD
jgi:hypothetical protein